VKRDDPPLKGRPRPIRWIGGEGVYNAATMK
jgi:hypothetical protein